VNFELTSPFIASLPLATSRYKLFQDLTLCVLQQIWWISVKSVSCQKPVRFVTLHRASRAIVTSRYRSNPALAHINSVPTKIFVRQRKTETRKRLVLTSTVCLLMINIVVVCLWGMATLLCKCHVNCGL